MSPPLTTSQNAVNGNGRLNGQPHPTPKNSDECPIQYLELEGWRPFVDERNQPFVAIPRNTPSDHLQVWPLNSMQARRALRDALTTFLGERPTASEVKETLGNLAELACDDERVLHNRIASEGQTIIIDLTDKEWQHIKLSARGWHLAHSRRPIFRRHSHQRPLVVPVQGGDCRRLFDFVPVRSLETQLMILVWLAACFVPWAANYILLVIGQQGSAKTTLCRFLRNLVDPSRVPGLAMTCERDLHQVLHHHAAPCFDNVGKISDRISDVLCRAITGEGIERRRLYTDADSLLLAYRRPIILNGISAPSRRADFLDRTLPVQCERLTEFRQQSDLEEQFARAAPQILGGLLDCLVTALRLLPETSAPTQFRLADFAHFGRAFTRALGQPMEDFDTALEMHLREAAHLTIEDQPIVRCLVELASKHEADAPWKKNATALLQELRRLATPLETSGHAWPQNARALSALLESWAPALAPGWIQGLFLETELFFTRPDTRSLVDKVALALLAEHTLSARRLRAIVNEARRD